MSAGNTGDGQRLPTGSAPLESEEVRNAHPLARFFFLQPIFGILLVATLLLGGVMAYTQLVKESLPDLNIPQATITTTWPGADPLTMEEQVTDIIEDEVTTLQGVRRVDSASFDSFSIISVEFEASAEPLDAMTRLRAAVADAEAELPADVERPTISQASVDDRPIFTFTLHGAAGSATMNEQARRIRDTLERVPGVNEVDIGGEREEIVQILLRPERLLALGLSPATVRNAVQQANIEQPFGEIRSDSIGAVVRLEGRFRDVADLRALPVARLGGAGAGRAVRLDEIASVSRMQETETSRAFFVEQGGDFEPSLEISVRKSPGADTVNLVETLRSTLARMEQEGAWPVGLEYTVTQDEARQIWEALSEVFVSALQTMAIVFVILLLTIAWREAVVAGLSVPITFAGVLLAILVMGYSLNELVVIGMVIALVMIIDVFIILMEGLHDEIYVQGKTFGQGVLATVKRYAMPAFAAQLTTILALAPLMSIGGTVGEFIRVLPATAVVCLVISFIVAMLCSLPLSRALLGKQRKPDSAQQQGLSDRVTSRAVNGLESWNARWVVRTRKQSWLWVLAAIALFMVSMVAFTQARIELFPPSDGERLGINIELPPTAQLATSQQVADEVGEILRSKPYFQSVVKLVGLKSPFAGGSMASNLQPSEAENFIGFSAIFLPRGEREADSYVLAEELRRELTVYLQDNVAAAQLLVVPEASGPGAGDPIEIQLLGADMDELLVRSREVQALLADIGGVVDVRDNIGMLKPQLALRPDREAANFFGIGHDDLASQVRIAFSSDIVGTFVTASDTDNIDIRLGTEWPSRPGEAGGPRNTEELSRVRAFTEDGASIALNQLLTPAQSEAAIAISHSNGERALTVMAKNEGRTVGEIMAEAGPRLADLQATWPDGYRAVVGGESADTAETFTSALIALLIAVVLIVGVLVIVFSSFRQAFIIFATMPLAIIGSALGFWAFDITFSFFAMIGLVSLIGIAINNGIIMVDTMNGYLKEGMSITEAAAAGSARRLRPLLTTAVTTIVGLVPLAISSAFYRPLTLVIIFGLVSVSILALIVVPALYLLLTPRTAGQQVSLD
ncbi:efflux RND transporter permease subunit [Phytopseudomonas dryadis]|uniref:AcrB/AcrD/AcrF family protein n=1 Tax=Phytopseudomonas dryadis TaxID=2487520 RepID=A0A4Q9QZU1_9GAMM|nr:MULTISPECIES: efflux RND transporter permease subunit [Pseudomonas]TBU91236.1 AcrB/AcrD/AcrF family protein [Pseudomonas dryadis]TBV02430.1 AcrB/AcrD/AcrF family protein [Pseudomonas dryadis]TBV13637.1 AcrB/AcrD/AcrF family protein [Pseudomonas sp. FRB 230]